MDIEKLLNEEIVLEFDCLRDLEAGTDEYKATVDGVTKLLDRAIEIDKLNIDHEEKLLLNKEEKKDRLIRHGINVASIVLPICVTIWGTLKSFKFEEEGTVTTIMGRGFINKLLPKK